MSVVFTPLRVPNIQLCYFLFSNNKMNAGHGTCSCIATYSLEVAMRFHRRLFATFLTFAAIGLSTSAASTVIYVGSGLTENGATGSAQAQFNLSGSTLAILLSNTSGDTAAQGDTLTGIVFSINGSQTLSFDMTGPTCGESLGAGSAIWTSGAASNTSDALCGSWTSVLAALPPVPAEFGVATTGFNGEFNGGSITLGNASPDYGIVGSTTFPGTIGGSKFPFIQNQLLFNFGVTSGTFTEADITGVSFLFGTDGTADVPGTCLRCTSQDVPEPSSMALFGIAGAMLWMFARRKRRT